jgi:exopolysaccharide production protein ExoY
MAYDLGVYPDSVRERAVRNVLTSAAPMPSSERVVLYDGPGKRLFDLAFVALIALPVVLVLAVLSILVAMDGHSPFYVQKRLGMHGKVFRMYKLRTMVPNADKVLNAYLDSNPEARAEWDRNQKLRKDPRVTWIGRLIRKTSLDELPQFLNVLKGEMSVVGPRPMMTDQRDLYPGTEYFEMRPGITGAGRPRCAMKAALRSGPNMTATISITCPF